MVLTSSQVSNFNKFRVNLAYALRRMHDSESNPHIKLMLGHVLRNVVLVPINFMPGFYLAANEGGIIYGENIKQSFTVKQGHLEVPHVESAIRIPSEHLFEGEHLRPEGMMTLLHEYSHIVLPVNAYNFTKRLGLPLHMSDELFADLLAVRIATRTKGVPHRAIASHIIRRQANYGRFPFARKLLRGRPRGNIFEIPFRRTEKAIFSPFRQRVR
jgi:hypothetical protein